jgi:hypothetical protein
MPEEREPTQRNKFGKDQPERLVFAVAHHHEPEYSEALQSLNESITAIPALSTDAYGMLPNPTGWGKLYEFARAVGETLRQTPVWGPREQIAKMLETVARSYLISVTGGSENFWVDLINRIYNAVQDSPFGRYAE